MRLFPSLHLSYLPLLSPLFASLQMDNKGWNGQKASFTEATTNSEYLHISLCLCPLSLSSLSTSPRCSLRRRAGFSGGDGPAFNLCDWSMGF